MDDQRYQRISFAQARELMDSGRPFVFLDVRTEEEYAAEHAAGAVLFPLDEIDRTLAQKTIPDPNTAILLYCRTGRRSRLAAAKLLEYGYSHIYDLGSLSGWPYGREYGA